jgi:hypothetical protein
MLKEALRGRITSDEVNAVLGTSGSLWESIVLSFGNMEIYGADSKDTSLLSLK